MKKLMTFGGLLLILVLFLAFNMLTGATLRGHRLDLTENKLYTLSDGTKNILRNLKERVTLRFYFSKQLADKAPGLLSYAQRVRELLEEYAAQSGGQLLLEVADPEPFSETEDRAVGYGLKGVQASAAGEMLYFGLAGSNSVDDEEVIEFFQESREQFLEYDVTRLVHNLSNPKRPVVGVLSSLPLEDNPMARMMNPEAPAGGWLITEVLRQSFDVRMLPASSEQLDADLEVLIVAHPQKLSPRTLFEIDQFVLRGGKLLAFVDPRCEAQPVPRNPQNPLEGAMADRSSSLGALLGAWGLELPPDDLAADRTAALRVPYGPRNETADYVVLMGLTPELGSLDAGDPVTSELKKINLFSAGVLRTLGGATTTVTPLIQTTETSMLIEKSRVQFGLDPTSLLESFQPSGSRLMIAARVTGPARSAFPDGPPAAADGGAPEAGSFLKESTGPIHAIVVADADLLDERLWTRVQNFLGQKIAIPFADNANFVVNAVDNLCGSSDLIGLRSRGLSIRPFDKVAELRREAESQFRQKEKDLEAKLKDAEQRINDLQSQKDAASSMILTPEQQAEIERFREDRIATRKELRRVRHELNKDIERLKTRLVIWNAGAVPALVALAGLVVWRVRRKRMQDARTKREGS